ncbi:MAG: 16S rRNA (adenine(1518)-N(6)/adenine(1519)-N(6))-dimethyltransferase RsmA [Patescibacteria group bacterium]
MDNNLYKQAHIRALCAEYGFTPQKSFGQNYLITEKPIEKIIAAGELEPDDTVVEIGPGFGALTLAVAPLVEKVIAFEIEQALRPYWAGLAAEYSNVEVVWGDALEKIFNFQFSISKQYKVVANLPYSITSSVLRTLLELKNKPERIVVMVQEEVADRICARAGGMSLLAVSVQYYGRPKFVFKVTKGCFWPSPKIDSAVLAITDIKIPVGSDPVFFFKMARAAFAYKRKQMWKNIANELKIEPGFVKQAILAVVGNEKARAEDLGIVEWLKLEKAFM